jgi:hypothetical protein
MQIYFTMYDYHPVSPLLFISSSNRYGKGVTHVYGLHMLIFSVLTTAKHSTFYMHIKNGHTALASSRLPQVTPLMSYNAYITYVYKQRNIINVRPSPSFGCTSDSFAVTKAKWWLGTVRFVGVRRFQDTKLRRGIHAAHVDKKSVSRGLGFSFPSSPVRYGQGCLSSPAGLLGRGRSLVPSECARWNKYLALLLPAPSLYSRLLRRNVWRMVARIRAKTWSIGSTGRFSPARHHGAFPSLI